MESSSELSSVPSTTRLSTPERRTHSAHVFATPRASRSVQSDFGPLTKERGRARAASQHRHEMEKEGGMGFARNFAKAIQGGLGGRAAAYGDLDSDHAGSEAGGALQRIADTIERLESKMVKGIEGVYAEIRAVRCRVAAIDETLQRELWDSEDAEMDGAEEYSVSRTHLREKVNDVTFEVRGQKDQLNDAIAGIQAGAQRMGRLDENMRLEVATAVIAAVIEGFSNVRHRS